MNESKNTILNRLRENINSFTSEQMRSFLVDNIIAKNDLCDLQIPEEIQQLLFNDLEPYNFFDSNPMNSNTSKDSQIYFWGHQGVGKTSYIFTLLREILNKKDFSEMIQGIESDNLKNYFKKEFTPLPKSSNGSIAESIVLKQKNKRIEFIEVNWQVLVYLYQLETGLSQDFDGRKYLDSFLNNIKNKNDQVHFFLIENNSNDKTNYSGLTQNDYLLILLNYLRESNLFNKRVKNIYLVITKSDYINYSKDEEKLATKEVKENFMNIYHQLKVISQQHNIDFEILPSSIGHIYFKNLCHFQKPTSLKVETIIKQRTSIKDKLLAFFP